MAVTGIILGALGIILIPIIAIAVAIFIPGFVRGHLRANESSAQTALKTISVAYENFYVDKGAYPASVDDLANADIPYIDEDYASGSYRGYNISCRIIGSEGYTCTAAPVNCGVSGSRVFVIDDTGTLYDEECD
jgi:Tfp pilus assembly protein PilE